MPPNPLSNASSVNTLLLEAHEDRLQTLEQSHGEVAKQVAVLTEQVTYGFRSMSEKIDTTIVPFAEKLADHIEADKDIGILREQTLGRINENERFIKTQLAKDSRRSARWAGFGKSAWGIILIGIGACIKELISFLWKQHLAQ